MIFEHTAAALPRVYLVGAIRDNHQEDIAWRARVITCLSDKAIFLNPLGGKTFDPETGLWRMSGILATAQNIVKHDCWAVDHADIIIANLTALSEGYPNIGSLVEFGRATARGSIIYTVIDKEYTGHSNLALYKLHPFLSELSARTFESIEDLIFFLARHLDVLSGANPHFDGVVVESERKAA